MRDTRLRGEALRETPSAREELRLSQTAHRNRDVVSAARLLKDRFGEALGDSELLPDDIRVKRYTSDHAALVARGQTTELALSELPLRANGSPVDLSLVPSETGFAAKNPLVPLAIPELLSGGVRLGDPSVTLTPLGSAGPVATRAHVVGNTAVYGGVAVDTDVAITPTARGLELFWQLRSPASPEALDFEITGPEGSALQQGRGETIEVVRGGYVIARVHPAAAMDSQRREVPVRMDLHQGGRVRVHVDHHAGEYAYPILVDPPTESVGMYANEQSLWAGFVYNAGTLGSSAWSLRGWRSDFARTGLWIGTYGNHSYAVNQNAMWYWRLAQNTTRSTYIAGVDWNSIYTNQAGRLWVIAAMHSVRQGQKSVASWWHYGPLTNHSFYMPPGYFTPPPWDERWTDQAHLEVRVREAFANSGVEYHAFLGNAVLYLKDPDTPSASLAHSPNNVDAWVHNESKSVAVTGSDPGFGARWFAAYGPGYERHQSPTCTGVPSPYLCPPTHTETFSYDTAGFAEGISHMRADVSDGTRGTTKPWDIKVDRSPPVLDFRGSTIHQGGQATTEASPQLKIKATDGSLASDSTKRSGVRTVEVYLRRETDLDLSDVEAPETPETTDGRFRNAEHEHDGFGVPVQTFGPYTCPQSSCERNETWSPAVGLPAGEYTVRVVAKDQLADSSPGWQQAGATGHAAYEDFPIFVPAQQVDRDADRIGLENWWSYESTDTGGETAAHVNLDNGNLVWHSTPMVNPGRGLSTVVNLTYNSQQRVQMPLVETPVEQLYRPYDEAGQGFSLGVSGPTRLNERLNVDLAEAGRVTLTDADGTRHLFTAETPGSSVFLAPKGVQLHLRRFSRSLGPIDSPLFGFERLEEPNKAWAATRPDGVTFFFDQVGYLKTIEDRVGNVMRFTYEFRSPMRDACQALVDPNTMSSPRNVFFPVAKVCPRKVTEVEDPGGRVLSIAYKPRAISETVSEFNPWTGVPSAARDAANQSLESAAYASGPIDTIQDEAGRVLDFNYDADSRLTELVEAKPSAGEQRKFTFAYETAAWPNRPLTSVEDPNGRSTTIEYEATADGKSATDLLLFDREVTAITDRRGAASRTAFNVAQEVDRTVVTDTRGKQTTYELDARGRMSKQIDARGAVTDVAWDNEIPDSGTDDNNVAEVTRAAGTPASSKTSMNYNANGLLLSRAEQVSASEQRTTTFEYLDHTGIAAHQSGRVNSSGVSVDAGRLFVSDLVEVISPNGGRTKWSYGHTDAGGAPLNDGLATQREDPERNPARTEYGPNGVVTAEVDEVEGRTEYSSHDPCGLPQQVTDPEDGVWAYRFDKACNVVAATDPRGAGRGGPANPTAPFTSSFTYDGHDRILSEQVPKRSDDPGAPANERFTTRSWSYDLNGNLRFETDGIGRSTERTYTPMDEVERRISAAGDVDFSGYDTEGNVIRRVAPLGMVDGNSADDAFATDYTYDDVSNLVKVARRSTAAGEPAQLITSMAYDLRGNVVGLADPRHNAAGGDPIQNAALATGQRYAFEYDLADNRVAQVEDPGVDNPATPEAEAHNFRTEYAWDGNGNRTSVKDARGNTTTFRYDLRDLLVDVIDPLGKRTHYGRRPNGQLKFEVSPRGTAGVADTAPESSYANFRTDYTYDEAGELAARSIPKAPNQYAGLTDTITYGRNAVGDPTTITDGRGNSFTNTFLDSGELASTGRPSWWTHDTSGDGPEIRERTADELLAQPRERTDLPDSHATGDFGLVDPEALPDVLPPAGQTSLEYDDELRLTAVTDAGPRAKTFVRDELGRITKVTYPLHVPLPDTPSDPANRFIVNTFSYDRNGNLRQSVDGDEQATTFDYDQFDRRVRQTAPGTDLTPTEVTDYVYDANDNVTRRDTPRGTLAWTMAYDAVDRLSAVDNPAGERRSFAYDPAGNLTSETTPLGHTWAREYNARDDLTKITAPSAGQSGAPGRDTTFEYDDNGNQTLVDKPGAGSGRIKTERVFDGRDLLWAETTGTSTKRTTVTEYDANGNLRREVKPAGVDEATNRPTVSWDGSALTPTSTAAENATVYEYNTGNLLRAIHLPFGDPDGGGPASADMRRFRQDFNRDSRGRVESLDSAYEWSEPCPTADPESPHCPARTSYTFFATGWPKTQSEPTVVDPDSGQQVQAALQYDYDGRGNQKSWMTVFGATQRRIVTRSFHPNGTLASRIAKEAGTGAEPPREYQYKYNPNRSLIEMRDVQKSRTTGISYDNAERPTLVNERWTSGKDSAFAYDSGGNVVTRRTDGTVQTPGDPASYQGGTTTSFGYDALERETSTRVCVSGPVTCVAGSADRTTTTDYYDGPRVKTRRKPNGVVETVSFLDDDRLASMKRTKGDAGATLKDLTYTYDRNGNRTQDERGTHLYNARDQLVRWTRGNGQSKPAGSTVKYTLNGSGAITLREDSVNERVETYTYVGDRLRTVRATETGASPSTATYYYDEDGFGNLERIVQPGQDTTYGYDAFGRMTTSDGPGVTDQGTVSYDGLDRRDAKAEAGEALDYAYVGLSEKLSREQTATAKVKSVRVRLSPAPARAAHEPVRCRARLPLVRIRRERLGRGPRGPRRRGARDRPLPLRPLWRAPGRRDRPESGRARQPVPLRGLLLRRGRQDLRHAGPPLPA